MLFTSIRKYTVLILCFLSIGAAEAQRRYQIGGREEYTLSDMLGITMKDVDGKVDAFFGLHANQYVGSHHLFGFSAEGSWTSFANNMPVASMRPGGGALGVHFLYEYQYSGLLIQTGLGINAQQVFTNVADADIYHEHVRDTWDGIEEADITLKHEFRQRCDVSRNLHAQVPLYVGQYIFGAYGMGYWLGGLHLNYAFRGDTKQTMLVTTKALYEPYLGVWHEMDNHGYRHNVPIERKGDRLKLSFDLMFHAEAGYEYTTWRSPNSYRVRPGDRTDCRMRFAAFADFSLLDICPRTDNVLYDIPAESLYDFPTYRMDHVFSTAEAKDYWMRNLYVGVRFTILFGLPQKEYCILCDPAKH